MTPQNHVLFSGTMDTCYSQMYILSGDYAPGSVSHHAFRGQTNGLCGGAVPGGLYLRMGVHTGNVFITVEIHDIAPPIDDSWEEIVEASCYFNAPPISLQGWDGTDCLELPLKEGEYRVRFCARGYTQSEKTRVFGDPLVESYCLLLWPGQRRADEVLKQTSDIAMFRHQIARKIS